MSYGKVHDVFWEDDKIDLLSDRAALMALFLISGPHRNAIGCFRLGLGAITDLRRFSEWGREGASKALQELSGMGFIARDDRTGWTFIRNTFKHDPITNKNAAKHALDLSERVPKGSEIYQELIRRLAPQLEAYSKDLTNKPGWPLPSPSKAPPEDLTKPLRTPLPSPLPKIPSQEGDSLQVDSISQARVRLVTGSTDGPPDGDAA